jgi:hypothetical protein
MNHGLIATLFHCVQQPLHLPYTPPPILGRLPLRDELLLSGLPAGLYWLGSLVAVLLASPKLGVVKKTFLLCSKGTLSLCRYCVELELSHRA